MCILSFSCILHCYQLLVYVERWGFCAHLELLNCTSNSHNIKQPSMTRNASNHSYLSCAVNDLFVNIVSSCLS